MNIKFYFDLEETLINSFHSPIFCNQNKIERFIKDNEIKEIGIFSAAICNIRDKEHFILYIKEGIEKRYGIKIIDSRVITMQQVVNMYMSNLCISLDISELLSLYGKNGAFHQYCNLLYRSNHTCILLDDAFDDITIHNHKTNLITKIVNITELKN